MSLRTLLFLRGEAIPIKRDYFVSADSALTWQSQSKERDCFASKLTARNDTLLSSRAKRSDLLLLRDYFGRGIYPDKFRDSLAMTQILICKLLHKP